MPLTLEELTWCAGLLEGEGSFCVYQRKGKHRMYNLLSIQCGMHERDRDVLQRLQKNLGGSLTGPYGQGKNRYMLSWGIYKAVDVVATIKLLYPYLGTRRKKKCDEILAAFEQVYTEGRKKRCP